MTPGNLPDPPPEQAALVHLAPRPPAASAGRPWLPRRVAPAAGLLCLAPLVGEYLLGNISIVDIGGLLILAPMYGGGAILIREVARRTGRGWPTMLVLGLAYGLIQAGLIDQSLFEPPALEGLAAGTAAPTFVPAFGFVVSDLLAYVVGHAVWSIGVPIAITEAFVPARRATPWLGRVGVTVAGVLYLAGSLAILSDTSSPATTPQLVGVAVVSALLVWLAFAPGRRPPPVIDRPGPRRPWLTGVEAFVASFLFGWSESWMGVVVSMLVAAAVAVVVARLSQRPGWGDAHRLALAGGALLHHAVIGFYLTQLYGREGPVHVIGNAVFALAAVTLLLFAVRSVRHRAAARPVTRASVP